MNLEWDVPFFLISPVNAADTSPGPPPLPFNKTPAMIGGDHLGYFVLDPARCVAGAGRRVTRNNLAQADGELTHRKFKTGYVMQLDVQFWERIGAEGQPACAGTLREMADLLGEYLETIANIDGQLVWQPSPWPADAPLPNRRLLDMARSLGPSGDGGGGFVSITQEKDADSPLTAVTFALLSPLPYVTDYMNWPDSPDAEVSFATETSPGVNQQAPDARVTVANEGNVEYQPIFRIHGPASYCKIINYSAVDEIGRPLQIVYDATLRGGFPIPDGKYVEIDCFHSTARLHYGAGLGTANAKACIDVLETDFFGLVPGDNDLFVNKAISFSDSFYTGDGVEVVYRNAWA
jgi:hypothetical protein